ncbi:hypothetical protein MSAN_02525200 [Mycena sanguinolenta]|uniref:Uncharacterized protein n=1 Tax=Mycena sanguinolenta TaxID=230812 RepID=A0A8H6WNY6_9AGAR|nr:hypothetical protein MSAN_02525200 [Mycena sanguinolenta]
MSDNIVRRFRGGRSCGEAVACSHDSIGPSDVDILLYGLGDNTPVMHTWSGVPYAAGGYNITLQPSWWNSTSSKQLQFSILSSGTPSYISTLPAGPVFTATYSSSSGASATVAADTGLPTSGTTTYVSGSPLSGASTHKLSAGKKAAVVLLPLLFVILCGLAYLKIKRARRQAKRSAWSEKLDKRMSTISADWKSITTGSAKEAVCQSIAASRPSNASFSYAAGAIKTGAVEGEPVVMGEKTRGGSIEISEKDLPRTTLARVSASASVRVFLAPTPTRPTVARALCPLPTLPTPVLLPAPAPTRAVAAPSTPPRTPTTRRRRGVPAMPPGPGSPFALSCCGNAVYGNAAAWSSGERVEGVDGGYGAQSVSPTGRVHTINYPAGMMNTSSVYDNGNGDNFTYGTPSAADASVSPPSTRSTAREPSADSAYTVNTFSSFPSSGYSSTAVSSPDLSGTTSPRQTAGPLTLTPEDIRRRMTMQHGQEGWRQSVDEVFGALSLMRTCSTSGSNTNANEDDDGDEYLFAPSQSETVFAYPGTPAPGSGFGSPAPSYTSSPAPASTTPAAVSTPTTASSTSPFAMPMQPPTMSPDAMLRAYAAKHASVTPSLSRKATAEVVGSLKDTGMRVLYKPEDDSNPARAASPGLIRAGPGARISR